MINWQNIREVKFPVGFVVPNQSVGYHSNIIGYATERNFKVQGTSSDAAESMVSKAQTLRTKVYNALKEKPMTADQVSEVIGETVLSTRPRLSELRKKGLIEDSGKRELNESMKQAVVWRVV